MSKDATAGERRSETAAGGGGGRGAVRRARVLAFMNQKGGVGKTTTVVNLAAGLAEAGRRVLVVDLDPQAHATLHLDVVDGEDEVVAGVGEASAEVGGGSGGDAVADVGGDPEVSVYDVLLETVGTVEEPVEVWEGMIERRRGLTLLPAVTDLAAAETELASADRRLERLRLGLGPALGSFEYVLLDCPPSLGLLTLNALTAADEVVVPMQSHFLALQGVGKLLETVGLVARDVNPRLRVAGVVLTQHDEQTRHGKEVVANLERFFEDAAAAGVAWSGAKVYRPAIRRNIKLAESPSFGMTIFEYDGSCAGARDYRALAAAFIEEEDEWAERIAGVPGVTERKDVGSGGDESDGNEAGSAAVEAGEHVTAADHASR